MQLSINGMEIPNHVLQGAMQHLRQEFPNMEQKQLAKKATEDVIKQVLLRNAASQEFLNVPPDLIEQEFIQFKMNFPNEAEFNKMCTSNKTSEEQIKDNIAENMRMDMFIHKIAGKLPEPAESDLRNIFQNNNSISQSPPEVTGAHIVRKITKENQENVFTEMCAVRDKLLDGADFAETANEYSECEEEGGYLGTFSPGKMVEEFETVLFSMKEGEISPIFQTRFGLHIATLYKKKEAGKLRFEDCEKALTEAFYNIERDKKVEAWLSKAREKADIVVKK